jgi:hypothetical protein
VTATTEAGSASATSAATGLVAAAAAADLRAWFPVAGPAGSNTIVPSKLCAFLVIWPGGRTTRQQR